MREAEAMRMGKNRSSIAIRKEIDLDKRLFNEKYLPYLGVIRPWEVYYGGSGSGKCFGRGTQVIMHDGSIKAVEDIRVGDKLLGINGEPRNVLDLSSGVSELYEIKQNKGMNYVVNGNHILCLKKSISCEKRVNRKRRYPEYGDYVEMSVNEYIGKSDRWKRNFMGYRGEGIFKKRKVEIDPYFLGVWLGDGGENAPIIVTEDIEIKEFLYDYAERNMWQIKSIGTKGNAETYYISKECYNEDITNAIAWVLANMPKGYSHEKGALRILCEEINQNIKSVSYWKRFKWFLDKIEFYKGKELEIDSQKLKKISDVRPLLVILKENNLIKNKHIPDDYLYNSRNVRLQVLAGLIDTDGSMSGNCFDIVQKNKLLAEQIVYLSNSLGLRTSIKECVKTCCNNGVKGMYYRVNISGNTQIIPTKIKRKQIVDYNKLVDPTATGITVTPVGLGEYYGFEIDGDHKFFLKDFTITHNSFSIGDKLAYQMTVNSGRNLVCLRKQKTDCKTSCFSEIRRGLRKLKLDEYWDVYESPSALMKNRVNGNQILFEGVDNIDDVKSIKFYSDVGGDGNLTDVWYEEADAEDSVGVIRELRRRLRDAKLVTRIILSFNPVSRQHWLFEFVEKELRGITGDIVRTCYDQFDDEVLILHSTWRDNRFLPKSYGIDLERLKNVSPYDYMVYSLGQWGVTGKTVFDSNKIATRLSQLDGVTYRKGYYVYDMSVGSTELPVIGSERFIEDLDGSVKIFEKPVVGHPYVMSIDTAGEGSDFYACHVFDNLTERQVAVFRDPDNPDECMRQCLFLAVYYNYALICVEVNFDTWAVKFLTMMEYPNLYRRMSKEDKSHVRREDRYGWRTQPDNRQMMLSELVEWANRNMDKLNDTDTLNEMLTFTRQQKKNKGIWWGAETGAHDDLVIALSIWLQARVQQDAFLQPDRKILEGFYYLDELEDMVQSGKITREMMREYINTHNHLAEERSMSRRRRGYR